MTFIFNEDSSNKTATIHANPGTTRFLLTNVGTSTLRFHQSFPVTVALDGGASTVYEPSGVGESALLPPGDSIVLSSNVNTTIHTGGDNDPGEFDVTPLA